MPNVSQPYTACVKHPTQMLMIIIAIQSPSIGFLDTLPELWRDVKI
jgi:hypothetical protein